MTRKAICFFAAGLLWACSTNEPLTLAGPGSKSFDGRYSVSSDVAWSELNAEEVTVWTINGFALEQLRFYAGLKDGDTLFKSSDENRTYPPFKTDMQASEIAEFVEASLTVDGAQQVVIDTIAPADFGSRQGFLIELSMLSKDGLELNAAALGSNDGERLDLLLYLGERHHYFPGSRDTVDKIFRSLETAS